jgi:hypothetical protein
MKEPNNNFIEVRFIIQICSSLLHKLVEFNVKVHDIATIGNPPQRGQVI